MTNTDAGGPLLGGILVGGRSSRMGSCKAMLQLPGGKTLLEHVAGCAAPYCTAIIVSAADADQVPNSPWPTVTDSAKYQGPVTGIAMLLAEAASRGAAAVLVLSVDLPALTPSDPAPLVDAWRRQPTRITTATFDGRTAEPLVAIYPTAYLDELTRLAAGEDRSIRRWLRRSAHQTIPLCPAAGEDVDTPEQWREFYERASNRDA